MLVKAELKEAMRPIFEPKTMPENNPVSRWCSAYAIYAQKAMAGAVVLSKPLTVAATEGPFLVSLDATLRAMWMSAVWVGPGVTAVTAIVPPVQPFLLALAPVLVASFDPELAPSLIAEALHTYTLSIIVSVIPPSGTPAPVPLT